MWLPFLATDRLRRRERATGADAPDERPLVLAARQGNALRLVDCDQRAVALGLTRGMTLADARARLPDLRAMPAEPEQDRILLERLALACERFTPLVAYDPPQGLMLDITGCAHLFGGEAGLLARLGERLGAAGLAQRCAIAGTPEAAHALSRHGRGGIVPPGEDRLATAALPVAALALPAETVVALSRAGLRRIADLARLPAAALAARFGGALTTRLRRVVGEEDVRITPVRPLPDCVAERHFADPVADMAVIEAEVAALAAEAGRELERRGQGGRRFEIALFRTDGAVRRLAVETGRPVRDTGTLLRLWRERVASLADPLDPGFGFDAIRLGVPLCESLVAPQIDLERGDRGEDDIADLLARLAVRFGRDRILRFASRDSHDPLRQARLVSALAAAGPPPDWPASPQGDPPARPLYLFEPPQPVETLSEVPDGPPMRFLWRRRQHRIIHAEGPERIAPEWWRGEGRQEVRDYYRLEDEAGQRFWLFRAGLHQEGAPAPRWYLHGLFA
ncbi:DNA polymerase Y family protein [Bosea sp. TWI1241]|uniref:Y-family DNA polymerase n=1 Tax=Bosea sp. TWI1241 TaxID=3148904 RepID=UPI0032084A90